MDFYNPELKQKYIETELRDKAENTVSTTKSILHRISVYEHQLNKDIGEFDDDELVKYIINDYFLNRSDMSRRSTLSRLRQYIKWYHTEVKGETGVICPEIFQDGRQNNKARSDIESRTEIYKEMWTARYGLADDDKSASVPDYSKLNALFKTEAGLFQYIQFVFQSDRYLMYKAVAYLGYYGFSADDIRSIKKADVDVANNTVRGRRIDNDLAFNDIVKAAKAMNCNSWFYANSPYLIRRILRGGVTAQNTVIDNDTRVSELFMKRFCIFQRKAIDSLQAFKYSGYVTKLSLMQKYRLFFRIVQDEQVYGESFVANKLYKHEYDEHGIKIRSVEYGLWKKNAKDP